MRQENTLATASGPFSNRWVQLTIAIVCMVMIANLQYGRSKAAIQVAFTNFVL